MKEFIDKLISRLEEEHERCINRYGIVGGNAPAMEVKQCMDIVNELAEEYKDKSNIIDGLKAFLQKKFDYCAEQAGMNLEAECNSEIASYFRDRKELYLDRANIYGEVMREIDRLSEEYNKKQEHVVWLNGCDDDTVFTMEMTNNEYEFLKRVSELANETSTYGCMPRMFVDEEGE